MPQFDTVTFFNQLFYFSIVFFCFYLFILGTVLPKIAYVLKTRLKKLLNDTASTDVLKNETSNILKSYDNSFLNIFSNTINKDFINKQPVSISNLMKIRSYWVFNNVFNDFFYLLKIKTYKTHIIYLKTLIKLNFLNLNKKN